VMFVHPVVSYAEPSSWSALIVVVKVHPCSAFPSVAYPRGGGGRAQPSHWIFV